MGLPAVAPTFWRENPFSRPWPRLFGAKNDSPGCDRDFAEQKLVLPVVSVIFWSKKSVSRR